MNALLNDFPEAIDVSGQIIDIDYSYRNCINIMLAWEDKGLTDEEKVNITINNLYEIEISEIIDINTAIEKAIMFLNCGEESEGSKKKPKKRVYSFDKDSKYIYSAVDGVLNNSISKGVDIHWWLFCMAFMEIPETCTLSKIISLRSKKNEGKLSKEEKKIYKEMIDTLELDVEPVAELSEEQQKNLENFQKLLGGAKVEAE